MSKASKGKPKYKLRGRPLSPETKMKLSEKAKLRPSPTIGRKLSEEHKLKIGISKIGNTNMLGKKLSEETRAMMSENKSRLTGKPIIQYDLHGNFIAEHISKRVAARATGVVRNVIKSILSGRSDSRHKYIFKHKKCE